MKRSVARSFGYILHLGITMIVPIGLMVFVGVLLNKWLNTNIAFIVCVLLGIGAGIRNCYILLKEEVITSRKETNYLNILDDDEGDDVRIINPDDQE